MDELRMRKRQREREFQLRRQERKRQERNNENVLIYAIGDKLKKKKVVGDRTAIADVANNFANESISIQEMAHRDQPPILQHQISSYPANVDTNPILKASPLSPVSMSQSPSKASNIAGWRNHDSKRRILNSSSSEEEDLVAIARRVEQNKKAKLQQLSMKQKDSVAEGSVKNPIEKSGSKKQLLSSLNSSSDEDEFDLIPLAHDLESKRVRKATMVAATEVDTQRLDGGSGVTDNRVVPHQNLPRNPLVLMRQEEEEASARNNLTPPTPTSRAQDQKLWSDNEDDMLSTASKARSRTDDATNKHEKSSTYNIDDEETLLGNLCEKNRQMKKKEDKYEPQKISITGPYCRCLDDQDLERFRLQNKPFFAEPKFGPSSFEPLELGQGSMHKVPASIARYLADFQKNGVRFMYEKAIVKKRGVILGDDMGLGKTVQTIALVAALLGKSGTGEDQICLKKRQNFVERRKMNHNRAREMALVEGRMYLSRGRDKDTETEHVVLPNWSPILIIAPNSVTPNWLKDFSIWGYFSTALYQGLDRERALESVNDGFTEVVVCAHSMLARDVDADKLLQSKPWKLVVCDELHKLKNEKTTASQNLRRIRDAHSALIIGLTGTVMANRHKELWNVVDIVAKDYFGEWKQFESEYARPISLSRSSEADESALKYADEKTKELNVKLDEVYLRRLKSVELVDILPNKDERIIYCPPSKLQKELYQHIIAQPDFVLVAQANAPCDCGVNRKFFLEFQHKKSKEERIAYQRMHRSKIIQRKKCCYQIPKLLPACGGPATVDPDAILWNEMHPTGEPCITSPPCPFCIGFTLMHILYKLSSHAALIQCPESPDKFVEGSKQRIHAERSLKRAQFFIPEHLVGQLPGGYIRESGIMDDHFSLSGKMAVLHRLLTSIRKQFGRSLIFSPSTQELDLIQNYLRANGISFLRMDGTTPQNRREDIAADFARRTEISVFLLSTNAMGVGLTITAANFVILFSVDWNPANDSQAQDRAFRIGQEKDVKVFRLVSRGTIEELKYLRQVYKTQLLKETIHDAENPDGSNRSKRLFRGVEGDKDRKGELFGMENLLKFKDGNFLNYPSKVTESEKFGVNIHGTEDVLVQVTGMSEEEIAEIGSEENMFEDLARCTENKLSDGIMNSEVDNDFQNESNLGGMSQTMLDLCDKVKIDFGYLAEEKDDQKRVEAVLTPVDEEQTLALEAIQLSKKPFAVPLCPSVPSSQMRKNIKTDVKEDELSDLETTDTQSPPPRKFPKFYSLPSEGCKNVTKLQVANESSRLPHSVVSLRSGHDVKYQDDLRKHNNISIVGHSLSNIRARTIGTTFSAIDLPLPGKTKKKLTL